MWRINIRGYSQAKTSVKWVIIGSGMVWNLSLEPNGDQLADDPKEQLSGSLSFQNGVSKISTILFSPHPVLNSEVEIIDSDTYFN